MTLNEITTVIASGESESKHLEFKAAAALLEKKGDNLREELSKDVSSFANSAGGKTSKAYSHGLSRALLYAAITASEHRSTVLASIAL